MILANKDHTEHTHADTRKLATIIKEINLFQTVALKQCR